MNKTISTLLCMLMATFLIVLPSNDVVASLSYFDFGSNDYYSNTNTSFHSWASIDIISEDYVIGRYFDTTDNYYKLRLGVVSGGSITYGTAINLYDTNGSTPGIVFTSINSTYFAYLYLNRQDMINNIQIGKVNTDNEIVFGNNYTCTDGTGSDTVASLRMRITSLSESDLIVNFLDSDSNREIFWYKFDDMNITSLEDNIIISDTENLHLAENTSTVSWITTFENTTDGYLYVNSYGITTGSIEKIIGDTLVFDGPYNNTGLKVKVYDGIQHVFINYRNMTDGNAYMVQVDTVGPSQPYPWVFVVSDPFNYVTSESMIANFEILDENTILAIYRDNSTYDNYIAIISYDIYLNTMSFDSEWTEYLDGYRGHSIHEVSDEMILLNCVEITGNYRRFTKTVSLSEDYEESTFVISITPNLDTFYWFDPCDIRFSLSDYTIDTPNWDWRLINATDEVIFSDSNIGVTYTVGKAFYIPNIYGSGLWKAQCKFTSDTWTGPSVEERNFTVVSSDTRYFITANDNWILQGGYQGAIFSAYEGEQYQINAVRMRDDKHIAYYNTPVYAEDRTVTVNELFFITELSTYYLKLVNATTGSDGETLAVSLPFTVSTQSEFNTYEINFDAGKTSFEYNEPIGITLSKSGFGGTGRYAIFDNNGLLKYSDTFGSSKNLMLYVDDTNIGSWKVYCYDDGGSIYDDNAIFRTFSVIALQEDILDMDAVDDGTKVIIGTILTMLITLVPLYITLGLKSSDKHVNVEIPPLLYAFFGGLGIIFCALIGLWGWEVPFFVIALMITVVMALLYVKRRGE